MATRVTGTMATSNPKTIWAFLKGPAKRSSAANMDGQYTPTIATSTWILPGVSSHPPVVQGAEL